MRLLWLFAVLVFAALGSTALATSFCSEITPGSWSSGSVEVSSEKLPDGDIKFSITITPKFSNAHYATTIGRVQITAHGQSYRSLRGAPADRNAGVIKCVFTVTQKDLEDPDLCFCLVQGADMSIVTQFIRLRKFLPP
jgi:hypothetical protein